MTVTFVPHFRGVAEEGEVTVISHKLEDNMEIKFGNRTIGMSHPTYFIADIAANHDGDLERAKLLIRLAKEAGADAAKFQNFDAPKIVSDYGLLKLETHVGQESIGRGA